MTRQRLSPRKKATQARAARTVEAVLEAAAQVFSRRGYAKATTNHIAARAGVSVGSVYQYFPNKDAILLELLRRHTAESMQLVRSLLADPTEPLAPLIRTTVESMVRLHTRNPRLHRVLFEEAPQPPEVGELLRGIEESAAEHVVALLRSHPEVRTPNPEVAAYFVVHTVEALTHHFVLHAPAPLTRDAFVDETARLLESYLMGPVSRPPGQTRAPRHT